MISGLEVKILQRLESRNLQLDFELDFELSLNSVLVTIRSVSHSLENAKFRLIITQVNLFTVSPQ